VSTFTGPGLGLPMAGWSEGEVLYEDSQLVIRQTIPPHGLSLSGTIDLSNVEGVKGVLVAQALVRPELHLELSRVQFIDVSGIRALAEGGRRANGNGRLVLHGLPPFLKRVMTIIGWDQMKNVIICECTTESE
jgi:anti-anti-sigma factor